MMGGGRNSVEVSAELGGFILAILLNHYLSIFEEVG